MSIICKYPGFKIKLEFKLALNSKYLEVILLSIVLVLCKYCYHVDSFIKKNIFFIKQNIVYNNIINEYPISLLIMWMKINFHAIMTKQMSVSRKIILHFAKVSEIGDIVFTVRV